MNRNQLRAALKAALERAQSIAATAEKSGLQLDDDQRKGITDALADAKGYKDQLAKLDGEAKSDADLRDQIKSFGDDLGLVDGPQPTGLKAGELFTPGKGRSAGERFVKSEALTNWLKQFPNGRIPEGAKGITSPPVAFGGIKDLLTGASDTSAGALVTPDRQAFVAIPDRILTIRDLVSSGTTGSDTVEYVKQGARTNNAAPVPEASSAGAIGDGTGGTATIVTGGVKPQSGFTLEKVIEAVKTIAHWIPATKRSLSDAGQIRTMIDNFLRTGLEEELEDQILKGDGTGENFRGILETAGLTGQPHSATVAGLDPLLETTLKAKTKVRTVGKARPTGYAFNPEDWEKIQLARLAKNPNNEAQAGAVQTLHGLPVVESEAMPVGTGMVADWKLATLWDREQAAVQVSDSHADFFIRNLVAFLAELRAAFGVLRPPAFVEIDLTA